MAAFKGGNNNMQNLMRQAQKMQEEMEKTAELWMIGKSLVRRQVKRLSYT